MLALRTQGEEVQVASIQHIKLMESERFMNKPRSNILQWLDYMERYLNVNQVAKGKKIQVACTYLELCVAQDCQILAKQFEVVGQDNCL